MQEFTIVVETDCGYFNSVISLGGSTDIHIGGTGDVHSVQIYSMSVYGIIDPMDPILKYVPNKSVEEGYIRVSISNALDVEISHFRSTRSSGELLATRDLINPIKESNSHFEHDVVENQVMGKKFRYCRNCKIEVS